MQVFGASRRCASNRLCAFVLPRSIFRFLPAGATVSLGISGWARRSIDSDVLNFADAGFEGDAGSGDAGRGNASASKQRVPHQLCTPVRATQLSFLWARGGVLYPRLRRCVKHVAPRPGPPPVTADGFPHLLHSSQRQARHDADVFVAQSFLRRPYSP